MRTAPQDTQVGNARDSADTMVIRALRNTDSNAA
jgi:hypothetical protein